MGKPRRINIVSVAIVVFFVTGGYLAWKLIPPYLQANNVDTELAAAKNELGKIDTRTGDDSRVTAILEATRTKLREMGVDDPELELGLTRGAKKHTIYAKYKVKVHLVFGQSITLSFHRTITMEAGRL